jgi:GntR family transcriptional regulator/MocR family aminotransferase
MLFPALRLGYVVIPRDLLKAFIEVRRSTDVFSPMLPQAVLTDFIREGHFARHIRRMRLLCRERRSVLVERLRSELGLLRVLGDRAGMYLSASLPNGWRDREISLSAAREGLWVAPLSDCYLGKTRRQGLILGYGGRDIEAIRIGIRQLKGVISRRSVPTARP